MALPVDRCSCARIPLAALGELGALRARDDVTVAKDGDHAWLHWPAGDGRVLTAVLAVRGAELFARGDDSAYRRLGERLPTAGVRRGEAPLRAVLPVPPLSVPEPAPSSLEPVSLRLVASSEPHPTTAALVPLAALAKWAETATSAQLGAVHAARAGDLVALRGALLPVLAGGERFWGARALVPLGRRVEPPLVEADLRAVAGAKPDEVAFFQEESVELIPESAFRVLTRASVRLAVRGAAP